MRFALYARVSTEDQQDPASSLDWQRSRSLALIGPAGGKIVTEYFDLGQSRSFPWKRRPEACALLQALADPQRGFDAVVIGEPARAFYGNQFSLTFPLFSHYGVQLWVPEVGGAIDPGSEAHEMMMNLYGGMSKGERNRIKIRVRSAMQAQAAQGNRFLGGRPPFGYAIVDAGPHPNPGKAAAGQRLHRLELDPVTAPVVARIFDRYLAGQGIYAIAEDLNRDSIPSPSGYDPDRNRHRASTKGAWSKATIRAKLGNAKYTGYHVWNRQGRNEVLVDLDDVALGNRSKLMWNAPEEWIWSPEPTHQAIVSRDTFEAARVHRQRPSSRKAKVVPRRHHTYCLSSRLFCDLCGRRMQGSWNHESIYYRCKFPSEYAGATGNHPKTIYLRESDLLPQLDEWLGESFRPENVSRTVAAMATSQRTADESELRRASIKSRLALCDKQLESYKALLHAGTEPAIVAGWINNTTAERVLLERDLASLPRVEPLSEVQIGQIVTELGDMVAALGTATPEQRVSLYEALGLRLTYEPDAHRVRLESRPAACTQVGVGGGT